MILENHPKLTSNYFQLRKIKLFIVCMLRTINNFPRFAELFATRERIENTPFVKTRRKVKFFAILNCRLIRFAGTRTGENREPKNCE